MAKFNRMMLDEYRKPHQQVRNSEMVEKINSTPAIKRILEDYMNDKVGVWAVYYYNPQTDEYRVMVDSTLEGETVAMTPCKLKDQCREEFMTALRLVSKDNDKIREKTDPETIQVLTLDWNKIKVCG